MGNEGREAAGYLMKDAGGVTDTCLRFSAQGLIRKEPAFWLLSGRTGSGLQGVDWHVLLWLYSWPQLGGGEGLSRHIC